MAGRHDRADETPFALLATGPIVARGLSRGVRGALRSGSASKHRAEVEEAALSAESDGAGQSQIRLDTVTDGGEGRDVNQQHRSDPQESGSGAENVEGGSPRAYGADLLAVDAARLKAAEFQEPEDENEPGSRMVHEHDRSAIRASPWRSRISREALGVVVLVLLAVICAGLIAAVVVKTRNDADVAAREAAAYTPPPLESTGPGSASPLVAVVGDESATRAAPGVGAVRRWPALLGEAIDGQVDVSASSGAGYTVAGANGATFGQAAAEIPENADVVLFVGGGADANASSLALAKAATRAFAAAAERAPGAEVIAVGPLFAPAGSDGFAKVRTILRSSADVAEIRWVDPVRSEWLTDAERTAQLTAAAERAIVARLALTIQAPAS